MVTVTRTLSEAFTRLGTTFGLRPSSGVPRYSVAARLGPVEIRRYEARLVVETLVYGAPADAESEAVRLMTRGARASAGARQSPAGSRSAPAADAWRVQYFMAAPDSHMPPATDDPSVRVEVLPPRLYAVLRFRGHPSPRALARQTKRLRRVIAASPWRRAGEPVAWFYDPPWTLPVMRRNEVAAPVEERG